MYIGVRHEIWYKTNVSEWANPFGFHPRKFNTDWKCWVMFIIMYFWIRNHVYTVF